LVKTTPFVLPAAGALSGGDSGGTPATRKVKVLVVDDAWVVRSQFEAFYDEYLDFVTHDGGEGTFEFINKEKPDIVFIDRGITDNLLDILKKLSSGGSKVKPYTILISGLSESYAPEYAGYYDKFYQKPFNIIKAVEELLESWKGK